MPAPKRVVVARAARREPALQARAAVEALAVLRERPAGAAEPLEALLAVPVASIFTSGHGRQRAKSRIGFGRSRARAGSCISASMAPSRQPLTAPGSRAISKKYDDASAASAHAGARARISCRAPIAAPNVDQRLIHRFIFRVRRTSQRAENAAHFEVRCGSASAPSLQDRARYEMQDAIDRLCPPVVIDARHGRREPATWVLTATRLG